MMLTAILTGGFLLTLTIGFAIARSIQSKIETEHPPAGEFIDVDGVRLHLRQTGPRDRGAAARDNDVGVGFKPHWRAKR